MNKRLDYLDSIRGVAALLVVIHHIFEVFITHNAANYPLLEEIFNSINIGRLGVIVFFITSGFVIPWSLKSDKPHVLKNFMIKRFFRLYPAYWFSIIAAVVIGFGFDVNLISTSQVLLNFTMIHKFLGVESVIGAYWTLHLELVFYVICAVFCYFGVLQNNKYLISVFILFCLFSIAFSYIRYAYGIRVPIMMSLGLALMFYGAVLRNYLLEKQETLKNPLIILTVFYFTCLLISQKFYYSDGWVRWFVTHVFSFVLFFTLVTKVKLNNILAVYLGRISYSLYLLNPLAIGVIFYLFGDFAFTNIGFMLVILTTLLSSILIAAISYRFIEQPSLVLARKFTAKYR